MNVRKVIQHRMTELNWSTYRLAQKVSDHIAPMTVYSFIGGKSEMTSAKLGVMLDALGLKIAAPDTNRTPNRKNVAQTAARKRPQKHAK